MTLKRKIKPPKETTLLKKIAKLDDDVIMHSQAHSGMFGDARWNNLSRRQKMKMYSQYLRRLKQQSGKHGFRIWNKDGSPNFD
tara:strand:+ start:285 stop:533 length:249 start_codon:yes stop_codon:yes gene_type:complete